MTLIDTLLGKFWGRIGASTAPNPAGLGVLRILTGLFLLLIVAPYSYWVGRVPQTLFKPPLISVMNLLPGFPPSSVMWAVDIVALSLACLVMLGVRARITTILMVIVGVFSSNATMCFGKIDHDGLFWTYLACMGFSGWGQGLALVPDKPGHPDAPARSMALLGVCLGFAMSVVGVHKALGWVDFDTSTSGFLGWFVQGYFVSDRTDLLAPYVLMMPRVGLELVDYAGVVFETGCVVALLIGPRAWRIWLLAACLFHLSNTLTLNIPFLQNLLLYWAFVDFSGAESRLKRWWDKRAVRFGFAAFGVASVLLHLGLRSAGLGRWLFFVVDEVRNNRIVLRTSVVVWVVGALVVMGDVLRRFKGAARPSEVSAEGSGAIVEPRAP